MTISELFEKRAERGSPRGAETVWLGANRQIDLRPVAGSGSAFWFRLAVIVFVGAAGLFMLNPGTPSTTSSTSTPTGEDDPAAPVGGRPEHVVVDGMGLDRVKPPFDPRFRSAEDGGMSGWVVAPSPAFGDDAGAATEVVFADPGSPFTGPIIGVEVLAGGGFRPWGANLGDESLDFFSRQLVRRGDSWTIEPESGLVDVATFEQAPSDLLEFGWQFDFVAGRSHATVQAEPHNGSGVWIWLARLFGGGVESGAVTVRPATVLGRPGLIINDGRREADEVVWADDTHVYRLGSSRVEGDSLLALRASEMVSRLSTVDDSTWAAMMADAGRVSFMDRAATGAEMLTVGFWILSSVLLLLRQRRDLAILGPLAVLAWIGLGPDWWLTIGLSAGFVALLWWVYRSPGESQEPIAAPGT